MALDRIEIFGVRYRRYGTANPASRAGLIAQLARRFPWRAAQLQRQLESLAVRTVVLCQGRGAGHYNAAALPAATA